MRTSLALIAVALIGSAGCAVHAGRYRPMYYGVQQPQVVYQQPQPVYVQQPVVYQQPVYQQPVYQQPIVLQAPPPVYYQQPTGYYTRPAYYGGMRIYIAP